MDPPADPDSEPDSDFLLELADPAWVRQARSRETDPARLREAMEQFAADLDRRAPGKAAKARRSAEGRRDDTGEASVGERSRGAGGGRNERGGVGRADGGRPGVGDSRSGVDRRGDRGGLGEAQGVRVGPGGRDVERGGKSSGRRGDRDSGDPERRDAAGEREWQDPQEVAREICLRLLAARPRTRAELAQALRKGRIDDEVAAAVLHRYDEVGMIDDAAFARAWVTSRHHGRGLASRALAQELRQRGVSKEDTDQALSELDSETESQTALDLVTRRLRSMHGEPEAIFRRLVGMLARKGYPAGVAVRAAKEALASRNAGAEGRGAGGWREQAELIDPDAYEE